jgi:hypothetical protein
MYVSVDIDLDDVYSSLRPADINTLISWLEEDGHLDDKFKKIDSSSNNLTLGEEMYIEKIKNLLKVYHRLSNEDEELLLNLVKKYE